MAKFHYRILKTFLKGNYSKIHQIVETGTHLGGGTLVMATKFEKVITIEIDYKLHKKAQENLKKEGFTNIVYIKGDSGECMKSIAESLGEPAVFYLDAHWSGDKAVDWTRSEWKGYGVDTGHAGKGLHPSSHDQVPLDREIEAIGKYFEPLGILYIDDLNKFDKRGRGLRNKVFMGEDWSHLNLKNLRNLMGTRVADWINLGGVQLIVLFKAKPRNQLEAVWNWTFYYLFLPFKLFWRKITRHHKKYESAFHSSNFV